MPAPNQPGGAVEIRDLGIGKLKADLAELARKKVTVGHQGDSGQTRYPGTDTTVALVAAVHEFGSKHVPARPFLRVGEEMHRAELVAALKLLTSDLVDGRKTLDEVLEGMGEEYVVAIRTTLERAKTWAAPLAASTIARKGHDDPLLDTLLMYELLSWAVRTKGADGSIGAAIERQGGEIR